MSFADRNIYFQQDYDFQIIGSNIKKFLVFSIVKTYQSMYGQDNQNKYETFLLVKSQSFSTPEKFLVFARQKVFKTHSQQKSCENHFLKSETYYSSFLRHVDLKYCRKLSEVLQLLNVHVQVPIQNQWFQLYQVHNYKPSTEKLVKYELKTPVYGGNVILSHRSSQVVNSRSRNAIISNLFRKNSQNIYFVSDSIEETQQNDLQLILSSKQDEIYGVTLKIKDEIMCIPLNLILYDKPCETFIDYRVRNQLEKTCYLGFMGSYCTGIEISDNFIITARHLLPSHQQQLDTRVIVKKYPYKQNMIGVVSKIGLGSLDIMQIQIIGLQNQNKSHKNKQNNLIKQELTGSLYQYQNKSNIFKFKFKKQFQQAKQLQILQENYSLGDEITAIGFGRFSFGANIFNSIELVLPTVANGIVSKVIEISHNKVFLKTDAKLFSGFSGCGIWKENLVAMAVFILKNKTSNSHLNRQNFSYTSEFIKKLLNKKQKQISVSFKKQIQQFDKIQTRNQIDLSDVPKPKL